MLMRASGTTRRLVARSFRSGSCHGWTSATGPSQIAATTTTCSSSASSTRPASIQAGSRWFATAVPTEDEDVAPAAKAIGFEKADELKNNLKPSEIVAALDRHIVGQQDAKKAVAIAMRNRWRRRQLPAELRKEVTPRNVLLVGPTGTCALYTSRPSCGIL